MVLAEGLENIVNVVFKLMFFLNMAAKFVDMENIDYNW